MIVIYRVLINLIFIISPLIIIFRLIKKKEDLLNLIHPDNDFKLCLDNAIQYVEENLKRTNEFTLITDYIENLEEKKRNKKFILISANKFKILEEKLKN